MMKELIIHNSSAVERHNEPVRVAVPCERGEFSAATQFAVKNSAGELLPVQAQVLKNWPDDSAKWLLLDFQVTAAGHEKASWWLTTGSSAAPVLPAVTVDLGENVWQVETGAASFTIDARIYRPFRQVICNGQDVLGRESSCQITNADGHGSLPEIEKIELEDPGPLHAVIAVTGHFEEPAGQGLRFSSRLHFYSGSTQVQVEFTLHNPQAARHPGGLWDLGDPGSVLFRSLAFHFPLKSADVLYCVPEPGQKSLMVGTEQALSLYQLSSGGDNWRSPVHRNRIGDVPHHSRGYSVMLADEEVASGERATPLLWCGGHDSGLAVTLPNFWQEFPKGLRISAGQLEVDLFSAEYPDLHELQGGEQKTHMFWLDFSTERDFLAWTPEPLQAVASPEVYRESGVLGDLPGHDDLVDRFTSPQELLQKREQIDEYGWRHFGEIYADHEAVGSQKSEPFISHYNNQYDFISGAYRKAFASGDSGWRSIAAELAGHVCDIDIYHTDQDREEYNRGLHWHTDHYLDAGLATHRSCSREHLTQKEPKFCGGGPGAEHCYTTGLALHYFQTGNPDFKQTVIDLADWELLALTGPQTVLAALKRGVDYFNRWRWSRGTMTLFPRFPLTRGTGNAVTACLDSFEVGGGRMYLDRAAELIRHALHPDDDIACRDLLNAETAWSYTVLLVAITKFLDKKCELEEFDQGFAHARMSFLAYADWMAIHEYPYLEKPEILEYPNETWAAQDLRKAVIFYQAARYADTEEQRRDFLEKARFFYDYAENELPNHPSSSFSRPVVLMLQNGWVGGKLKGNEFSPARFDASMKTNGSPVPYLTLGSVVKRVMREVFHVVRQTSLSRELRWLNARLKS